MTGPVAVARIRNADRLVIGRIWIAGYRWFVEIDVPRGFAEQRQALLVRPRDRDIIRNELRVPTGCRELVAHVLCAVQIAWRAHAMHVAREGDLIDLGLRLGR
jgi:hypothetical protein